MGIGFCEFLVASCAPSPEPSHSKASEITLGLDEAIPLAWLALIRQSLAKRTDESGPAGNSMRLF